MLQNEINLLKEALSLISEFQSTEDSPTKQETLQTGFYRTGNSKRQINELISYLTANSPVFKELYYQSTDASKVSKYDLKNSPEEIKNFLQDCYWKGTSEYNRWLNKLNSLGNFTPEELHYLRSLDDIPENTTASQLLKKRIHEKRSQSPFQEPETAKLTDEDIKAVQEEVKKLEATDTQKGEPQPPQPLTVPIQPQPSTLTNLQSKPLVQIRSPEVQNAAENLSSQAQIKTRRFLYHLNPFEKIGGLFKSVFGSGGYSIAPKSPTNLGSPSIGQKAASYASIKVKKLISRYGTNRLLASLACSAVGSVVGFTAGGAMVGISSPLVGTVVGGAGGFIFPNVLVNKLTGQAGLKIMAGGGRLALGTGARAAGIAGAEAAGLASGVGTIPTAIFMIVTSKTARKVIMWAVAGFFALVFIVLPGGMNFFNTEALLWDSVGEAAPLPSPPPGGGGDIGSCTFYRSGDTSWGGTAGLKFRISEWPALINEVASKVGVPSSILAGLLRVECRTCFDSDNPEYINNDYDSVNNGFAYGVMQFYPPTFEGVFNNNRSEMARFFGKTSVKTTIDPQSAMAPVDILRIYSIKDSVIAAAFKIKADAGMAPPYDRAAIDRIVKAYFTRCDYTQGSGTYSYCDDLWRSYTECQSIVQPPQVAQCQGEQVSFGTKMLLPLPDEKPVCSQTATESCGRPGYCTVPTKVVIHTTWSPLNARDTYNFFANGSPTSTGLAGVATQFITDKDGTTLQLVDLYTDKTEVAWGTAGYVDHVSIEMVHTANYGSKDEVPSTQYQATLNLVKKLMQQYNIPVGNLEFDWSTPSNSTVPGLNGIFGHYQLNPQTKSDPGKGFMRDFREDLKR